MQFMAVGTLAMKNRSSVAAAQQPFADAAPALIANIRHEKNPPPTIRVTRSNAAATVLKPRIVPSI
jgi:hypothetical protein